MKVNLHKFLFISGPCVIESDKLTFRIASYLKKITARYPVDFIFKASFDKANRTSIKSFRGPGIDRGLEILKRIKEEVDVKILSDVHCKNDVDKVKDVLDVIQIPAFLSRQTDLIVQAAKTKKIINIKKAQFMSPYDIKYAIEKANSTGNKNIIVTERGTCFGYNNLVVDFRSLLIMRRFGCPVVFDATHSVQRPSLGAVSGGDREFVYSLSKAAAACGVDGIFLEVHPHPEKALSDSATSYPLSRIEKLLDKIVKIREVSK